MQPVTIHGQSSLFGDDLAVDQFKKAVQVLHSKPRQQLTLLQRKLGNSLLKHAIEEEPSPDGWWEVGVGPLAASAGFDSNDWAHLKDSLKALMSIIFEWDVLAPNSKKTSWQASVLFTNVGINGERVRFRLDSEMREQMLRPDVYALIDMAIVRKFRRASTLAIWEHCIRYQKVGRTAEVPWREFRDMILGASSDFGTYEQYKFFKSKVLNPAILEICTESSHIVTLKEKTEGRRVIAVSFNIRSKDEPDAELQVETLDLVGQLVNLGIPQAEARRLVRTKERAEVEGALKYTQQRMGDTKLEAIRQPAAYFRNALTEGRRPETNEAPSAPPQPEPAGEALAAVRASYLAEAASRAQEYVNELAEADRAALHDRYNAQALPALRLKARQTKATKTAFLQWVVAVELGQGEPSDSDLLKHVLNSRSLG